MESTTLKHLNLARQDASRKVALNDLVNVPLDMIRKDETLPYPIYLKIMERAVLFRKEGDEITSGRAERLREKIESVCIPRTALKLVFERQESDMDPRTGSLDFAAQLRNLLFAATREVDREPLIQEENLAQVERLAGTLASTLKRHPELADRMIRRYSDPALYYVSHSVNVAIYSLVVGIKLNLPLERLKVLGFGALVHNIGNVFVPDNILFKKTPLSFAEWRVVQEHPMKGAQFLSRFSVAAEVVQMIEQHHERVDGKGYPVGLAGNQIHLFSRICSIADVYDALTSTRPYRKAVSPYEAVQIMRQMKGKFDPSILRMMAG